MDSPTSSVLIAVLLAINMAAALTDAEAKQVVNPECQWFGTAPACNGECPAGWTEKRRSSTGEGHKCYTGSKVYCCNFQETCVPEKAAGWQQGAQRTTDDGTIECQECVRWGDDCDRSGPPRFNTVCAAYKWVTCGHAPAQSKQGGHDIGFPTPVPDSQGSAAQPSCEPPHEIRNGVCACPKGLIGENCDYPDVR